VRIERGRVAAIGRGDPGGPCFDLGDVVMLPGLVNAHTHLEFSHFTSPLSPAAGHDGLPGWIRAVVASRRERAADSQTEAATVEAAVRVGLAESAAEGVTAIGEIATRITAVHGEPSGPRLRVFREGLGVAFDVSEGVVRGVERDLDRLARRGVPAGVSPHATYSVASSLGRDLLAIAGERRLPAAMHLAESPDEDAFAREGTGCWRDLLRDLGAWNAASPPQLLPVAEWIGRLARLPRAVVVHATFLDDAALARLARHADRLAVAVCPRTAKSLAGMLPPIARLRSAGVRIAIGTDSRASSPDLSVRRECAELVGAGIASPEEAVRMATLDAAWAIGLESTSGRIAVGRPADLAVLSMHAPDADPFEAAIDPCNRVVATLRGGRPIHESAGCMPFRD
jgi:cytosine/adenosine deaminase-related metal-dependent hydrolase